MFGIAKLFAQIVKLQSHPNDIIPKIDTNLLTSLNAYEKALEEFLKEHFSLKKRLEESTAAFSGKTDLRVFQKYLRFRITTSVLLTSDLAKKRSEIEEQFDMDPVEDNGTKQLQISDECLIVSGA